MKDLAKDWYESSYQKAGFAAQRRYPNEELLRFMGRNYFSMSPKQKAITKVLEIGCGSGANLWMLAREGFDVTGIDISPKSISLCQEMLNLWGTQANLKCMSMTELDFGNQTFDVVVDVFSSHCLDQNQFNQCLTHVSRILKPGGKFFSYTPSAKSDAFKNHAPSKLIDSFTLDGIRREGSPYIGGIHPFRFVDVKQCESDLLKHNLKINYLETVGRTYLKGKEYFEFVVMEAERI